MAGNTPNPEQLTDGGDRDEQRPPHAISPADHWYNQPDAPQAAPRPVAAKHFPPGPVQFPPGPVPQQRSSTSNPAVLPLSVGRALDSLSVALVNPFTSLWLWVVVVCLGAVTYALNVIRWTYQMGYVGTDSALAGVIMKLTILGNLVAVSVATACLYGIAHQRVVPGKLPLTKVFTLPHFGVALLLAFTMSFVDRVIFYLFMFGQAIWLEVTTAASLTVFHIPVTMYYALPGFLTTFLMPLITMCVFPAFEGHKFRSAMSLGFKIGVKHYPILFIVGFSTWLITWLITYVAGLVHVWAGFGFAMVGIGQVFGLLMMPMVVVFYAHLYRQVTGQPVTK